jgi:hypothetical protein
MRAYPLHFLHTNLSVHPLFLQKKLFPKLDYLIDLSYLDLNKTHDLYLSRSGLGEAQPRRPSICRHKASLECPNHFVVGITKTTRSLNLCLFLFFNALKSLTT